MAGVLVRVGVGVGVRVGVTVAVGDGVAPESPEHRSPRDAGRLRTWTCSAAYLLVSWRRPSCRPPRRRRGRRTTRSTRLEWRYVESDEAEVDVVSRVRPAAERDRRRAVLGAQREVGLHRLRDRPGRRPRRSCSARSPSRRPSQCRTTATAATTITKIPTMIQRLRFFMPALLHFAPHVPAAFTEPSWKLPPDCSPCLPALQGIGMPLWPPCRPGIPGTPACTRRSRLRSSPETTSVMPRRLLPDGDGALSGLAAGDDLDRGDAPLPSTAAVGMRTTSLARTSTSILAKPGRLRGHARGEVRRRQMVAAAVPSGVRRDVGDSALHAAAVTLPGTARKPPWGMPPPWGRACRCAAWAGHAALAPGGGMPLGAAWGMPLCPCGRHAARRAGACRWRQAAACRSGAHEEEDGGRSGRPRRGRVLGVDRGDDHRLLAGLLHLRGAHHRLRQIAARGRGHDLDGGRCRTGRRRVARTLEPPQPDGDGGEREQGGDRATSAVPAPRASRTRRGRRSGTGFIGAPPRPGNGSRAGCRRRGPGACRRARRRPPRG